MGEPTRDDDGRGRTQAMRKLAQFYHDLGANVAPLDDTKRPVITGIWKGAPMRFRWKEWETTIQTDKLWTAIRSESWWTEVRGVAAINGVNGWVNLDIDSKRKDDPSLPPVARGVAEAFLDALGLPSTYSWLVASPTGGWHIYARVDALSIDKGKLTGLHADPLVDHVELRHIGHYTALPGSLHPNGNFYQWANEQPTGPPTQISGESLLSVWRALTHEPPAAKPTERSSSSSSISAPHAAYAAAAVDAECASVAAARAGGRNDTLNKAAFNLGTLVGAGALSQSEAESALLDAAARAGLSEGEAQATINSGIDSGKLSPRTLPESTYTPQDESDWLPDLFAAEIPDLWADEDATVRMPGDLPAAMLLGYRAEDGGILDCWVEHKSDEWLYATGYETWYHWTGTHWGADKQQQIHGEMQRLMDAMNNAARDELALLPTPPAKGNDPDAAERATFKAMIQATKRSQARVNSVATMAQAHRATPADSLDQGNILNLRNGTLDLNTLCIRPHARADLLTYVLPYAYDPSAAAPRWEQFCAEVLVQEHADGDNWQTDTALVELLQEGMGYSLTNEVRHEAMFWLAGKPNSGKSTISHVLRLLLGDMALGVDFDRLGLPGDYTIAEVPGKRILYSGESRKGQRFSEGMVKQLVSGDNMTTARKYEHPFQFRPQGKIWWMMNDLPVITDTTGAIWRRLQLLPFHRTFSKEERDVALVEKLAEELPGILNWALMGLNRLRTRGRFPEPQAVQDAITEYMKESNPVAQWLDECATPPTERGVRADILGNVLWTPAKECFESYALWATANGRQTMNSTTFGRELARLATKKHTMIGKQYQLGLRAPAANAVSMTGWPKTRHAENDYLQEKNMVSRTYDGL